MTKVWTFKIVGGDKELLPIRISIPNTPLLDHRGGMTLWKMVGPPEWADAIEGMLKTSGAQVDRYTEGRGTDEEREERLKQLGAED